MLVIRIFSISHNAFEQSLPKGGKTPVATNVGQ